MADWKARQLVELAEKLANVANAKGLEELSVNVDESCKVTVRRFAASGVSAEAPVSTSSPFAPPSEGGPLERSVSIGETRPRPDILEEPDDPTAGGDATPTLADAQVVS